jgi:hypothetical protein
MVDIEGNGRVGAADLSATSATLVHERQWRSDRW